MGNIFSASEIVDLGIRIEENGRDFYTSLAAQSRNEKAAKVFKFLAAEEEKHILVFSKIKDKTEQYEPPAIYADEYLGYMNALAADCVFTQKNKGTEAAKKIQSDIEAAEVGIRFEKDSILLYQGMVKAVSSYDKKVVDELILQEENHLRQLLDLKGELRHG